METTVNVQPAPVHEITVDAEAGTSEVTVTAAAPITIEVMTSSDGTGMSAAVYDPRGIAADVFDLGNHTGTIDDPAVIIDGGLL